jgi:hypothetical protein
MINKCFWLALGWVAGVSVVRGVDWVGFADGKVDVAPELERALNESGSVVLPKGTYRLSRTVEVRLGESGWAALNGDGTARLVMDGAGPALHFLGSHEGSAAPSSFKPIVWERERAPMVSGIEIIGTHAEADGIRATKTMQMTLHRVVVRKCRHAVHLVERNRNVLISACHFYENRGIGVFYDEVNLHQSNIVGSHISYNGGGGVVSRGGNVRNLHIGTCDIESNHAAEGPATANVLLDSTGGSIGEIAITGCTIQHTNEAPDSANIRVIGAGIRATPKRGEVPEVTREGNVTITGNVFSDVQVNLEVRQARGVVVTGNTFWEGFQRDIIVADSSHVLVSGNNFDRNPRYLVNGFDNAERNGVVFERCEDSSLNGNLIYGVRKQRAAVEVKHCRRMQISQNSVLDSDGVSLLLEGVEHSVVTHNLLRDDREEGQHSREPSLVVRGGKGNVIEGNLLGAGERRE